ncbi:MAG TPA: M20/M25/M40 family metallo-hydrolase [Candidatus Acidoferrum sp.]|nr:M20/M25/M40 family metallo-hydrolase [Candidatus Acidoferrum sp.]
MSQYQASVRSRADRRRRVRSGRRPATQARPARSPLIRTLLAHTRSSAFSKYVETLLLELCRSDTTARADVAQMRTAEDACFQALGRELATLSFPATRLERRPINPAIQNHPHFSLLHFTKTAERPGGLSAEETYAGRSNLVYIAPGGNERTGGTSVALNAHIDVVAPWFPPRVRRGTVYGRGACDDKGPVVSIIGALKALSEVMAEAGLRLNRDMVAMFVVEEETGGNGSLSLAMDRGLKSFFDCVVVGECTGLKLHPANRGAVWYRAELKPPAGVSPFEMFAFVNQELEAEGAALRAESFHPLFPQRPVQTCHGILGRFGEHPSRICGEVNFTVHCPQPPTEALERLVRDCLEAGLAGYIGAYGDKTKVIEPASRKPLVARHYDLHCTAAGFQVNVHGATGHMGAIRERDGAITKLAHFVRSLVRSKARLEAFSGGPVSFALDGATPGDTLLLEGGQGFVPTHGIEEVMARLRTAVERGAENYLRLVGRTEAGAEMVRVTYEKLHNAAFDGDTDSPAMCNALAAARACRLPQDEPILGWTVSCDARLFACEYPGMPVLTFGPGQLAFAHSDQEQIALEDIRKAAEFLAVFLLRQTGTVG